MNNILDCRDVHKTYVEHKLQTVVLKNVSFVLREGEKIAIMGASGSGKSTLLHILGGLDKPSHGSVWVNGESIADMTEKKRCAFRNQHLGFVYQFHYLLPEFSVLENVCMPLQLRGEARKSMLQSATMLLEKVGLSHRLHHKPSEISGGERQRAAIARALITKPTCLLADEPTGNLDNQTAKQVSQLLCDLNQRFNLSTVLVTHDQQLAARMDRILYLENACLLG